MEINLIFQLQLIKSKSSWIHFEGADGNTVHRHASGVTMGYLFDSLGITVDDECFIFQMVEVLYQ